MGNHDLPEGFKMTELGPLPEEWEVVRLGEVAVQRKEFIRIAEDEYYKRPRVKLRAEGIVPRDVVKGSSLKIKRQQVCRAGEFLVAEIDAKVGGFGIVPQELDGAILSSHYFLFRIYGEKLNKDFLGYWIRLPIFVRQVEARGSTNYASIRPKQVLGYLIALPPLPEQRAIAHVLRTVQRAKEATERVIAATRELKKSLMRHLFTYGPVPLDQVESVRLKETELGPVPEGWQVVRLGEVAETTSGGTPSRKEPTYFGGNIAWVKSGELEDGFISWTEEHLSEEGLRSSNAKILPAGTLLIALYGATVGKTSILAIPAATNQAVCALLPKRDKFLPKSMMYYFIFRRDDLLRERYGGAQPNISQTLIRDFRVPLPPLPEQRAIAQVLRAVDRKIAAEEGRKAALDSLFKTLLHYLMTGKIRLPRPLIAQFDQGAHYAP